MNNNANDIFRQLFGIGWDTILEADQNIGAFVVLHDTKEAVTDKNAMDIMGFLSAPSYDELMDTLSKAQEYSDGRAPILLKYIETEHSNVTAGIIHLDLSRAESEQEFYQLSTQADIVKAIDSYNGDSCVMLIHLDGTDSTAIEEMYCYVFSALKAISAALPDNAMTASHSKNEFWIFIPSPKLSPLEEAKRLQTAVEKCPLTDGLGNRISNHHNMTFSAGICCGTDAGMYLMHGASFALYEAAASGRGRLELFDRTQYDMQRSEYNDLRRFSRLLDSNLFRYHFQPIVSAKSGEVVAYEALMRTPPDIGFNPPQILELATRYDRLYDIERLTINNALRALSRNQQTFGNRRLFINSIPSSTLTEEDYTRIRARYGELLEKTVIELTEQTEISDEMLAAIKKRLSDNHMKLAIDDYGAGYSNTSNLVRYAPDYVKIDRALIADIDRNPKMQALVKGTIDFIHSSGYIALAEGVETAEETRTMIELGSDLLQGFWVSRPKPVFVNEISETIRLQIERMNLEASGMIEKIYAAENGEYLDLVQLALDKYTNISLGSGDFTLVGERTKPLRMPVTIKENSETTILMRNVFIEPEKELPSIAVGSGSKLTIILDGENNLHNSGIFVPEGSELTLDGAGSLTIEPEHPDCYAIGCGKDNRSGKINIAMSGTLSILVNGENGIGIGGGRYTNVNITGGILHIACSCGNCAGIGSLSGDSDLLISNCGLDISASAASAVCAGSFAGNTNLRMRDCAVRFNASGSTLCGAGSLGAEKNADIYMENMQLSTYLKGKNVVNLGTEGGETNCSIRCSKIDLYSEGGAVSGIGDRSGGGSVDIRSAELTLSFQTGNSFTIGSPEGTVYLEEVLRDMKLNE